MDWLIVLVVGLLAGTLGGIVGFGTSIMLLPLLVVMFGPLEAVPIMAVTALMANFSRVMVWWREVDWKVCGVYSLTGIPCAALGAHTLLQLDSRIIEMALGIFFLLMIPLRRRLQSGGDSQLRLRRACATLRPASAGKHAGQRRRVGIRGDGQPAGKVEVVFLAHDVDDEHFRAALGGLPNAVVDEIGRAHV